MSDKSRTKPEPSSTDAASADPNRCVRSDLESRGVPTRYSQTVAERLADIAEDLDPNEYHAVLDGVAAACAFPHDLDAGDPEAADLSEMRRLVDGFSDELRKLDEGLQILSTYVARMTARAESATAPTLH